MAIWIRADGSRDLGIGHVMRTLALAQAATDAGVPVRFVMASDAVANALPRRFGCKVLELASADNLVWLAAIGVGDAVIFDGYHFGVDAFLAAAETGARVAAVDDLGVGEFPVDVLLNPSTAGEAEYETPAKTRILMGPRFALVRKEFARRRKARTLRGEVRFLVALGGSDATKATRAVLGQLPLGSGRFTLLVGPGASRPPALDPRVAVVQDPPDVAAAYDAADVAITAAGSSTWELACMGVPVIAFQVAPNQRLVGPAIVDAGAGFFVGDVNEMETAIRHAIGQIVQPDVYAKKSLRALALVDGHGAERVLTELVPDWSGRTRAPLRS